MASSFFKWVVFVVLLLTGVGCALELDGVPQCAITCLLDNLKDTSCKQEDTECLCIDPTYLETSTQCVVLNCTVEEALATKNLTSIACGDPIRNRDSTLNISRPILVAFKTIFLATRLVVKAMGFGGGWGWDDYIIIIAFGTSIGMTAMTFLEQQNGIGRDIWTLMLEEISRFLKFFFVFQLLYIISLGFVKASLMSFYSRRFPSPNLQLTLQLTQMINLFLVIAFSAATMLQCQPLSYFWTGWSDTTIADLKEGQCFNIHAFGYAHAGLNIALNVWLLILPLVQIVWARKACGRNHKLGVAFMFAMGIGLTAVAIVRLRYLWYVENTANPTHDYFGVEFISSIEVDVDIVLVCLPAMRLLFTKILANIPGMLSRSARPCSSCSTRSTPEDGKKLISNPINKQPLPDNHDWGFPKKHGYYDDTYDDWDCRIEWNGGPRDNPLPMKTPTAPGAKTLPRPQQQRPLARADEEAFRTFDLGLQPPTPPFYAKSNYKNDSRRPSIEEGQTSADRSFLAPAGWRDTLTGWRERRDTRTTRRSTWRSTLGWRERRDTVTSRIGEIKIMIDKAILRSDSPAGSSGSSSRDGPTHYPEMPLDSRKDMRPVQVPQPLETGRLSTSDGNNGPVGWI
ncbi:hypothetical protein MKZ38_006771 [Zalerion maritima]|uniref:CFEM domain-containing protein n=1 Tax=Zalerion maritima TaxID=339359 RepID=A0AAD5RIU4_9PEZI|nr:hypothetical protein MKZ38_006771 [Zalerion maritima]